MSNEQKTTENKPTETPAPTPKARKIESTEFDYGVDLNNLPPAPWTPLALGELFWDLSEICGAGIDPNQRNPSLDPRTFARGRMKRMLRLLNIVEPPETVLDKERGRPVNRPMTEQEVKTWFSVRYQGLTEAEIAEVKETIAKLKAEAEALQQSINAKLPAPTGTMRTPGAPPMGRGGVFKQGRVF